ncbi:MAG: hypothetical protein Q8K75_04610 [Chlamydiales bacterium]|nr:hypothetical protein [Chlamydiales bacterium]
MKRLVGLFLMMLPMLLQGGEFTFYHALKDFTPQGEVVFSNNQVYQVDPPLVRELSTWVLDDQMWVTIAHVEGSQIRVMLSNDDRKTFVMATFVQGDSTVLSPIRNISGARHPTYGIYVNAILLEDGHLYGIDDAEVFRDNPWSVGEVVENGDVEWIPIVRGQPPYPRVMLRNLATGQVLPATVLQ